MFRLLERALHCTEQLRVVKRLHDKISRAGLQRIGHQFLLSQGAAHYDARLGVAPHDLVHGIYAAIYRKDLGASVEEIENTQARLSGRGVCPKRWSRGLQVVLHDNRR